MHLQRFRASDGVALAGAVRGAPDAPLIVLLHGAGQTRHAWTKAAARLEAEGFRVLLYDARGHGESDWSQTGDYALTRYADDLRQVLEDLDARASLVGASLGGVSAMLTAAARPDLIDALVLVDIAPRFSVAGVDRIRNFMAANPDGFASVEEAAEAVRAHNPGRTGGNPQGLMRNLRRGEDGRLRWHWDPAILSEPPTAETTRMLMHQLERVPPHLPTLLVWGLQSDVVDEAALEDFRSRAPHAETASVAHAGHMVAGDRNDAFNDIIVGFLHRAQGQTGGAAE
ncbi:MAG TPA: alpha/beta hydrolase [Caulobacterales bacterium]|nr:alpha/beta hydrolase [Caulobacterales bacterium]